MGLKSSTIIGSQSKVKRVTTVSRGIKGIWRVAWVWGLLLMATVVVAQTPLTINDITRGTLSDAAPQAVFTLNAAAGQEISVRLIAFTPGLALQFIVTDPNGTLVRAVGNPAAASELDEAFTATVAGLYTITISDINGVRGDFFIQYTSGGGAPVIPQATNTPDARATCPVIVEQALQQVDTTCAATSRNQVCYGNLRVNATLTDSASLRFEQVGDIANLTEIQSLTTAPLNVATGEWGVALMRLQANLPDTVPGQNVTMLAFGDVQIQNAAAAYTVTAVFAANTPVRSLPGDSAPVLAMMPAGEALTADGRLADAFWTRVRLPDGQQGWISTTSAGYVGNFGQLEVITDPAEAPRRPMQAFTFQSGIGRAACQEAPLDGIVIQTPRGVGTINLTINGVDVEMGSTVFFRAQPQAEMVISVVEGQASVAAQGVTRTISAGMGVRVPMDGGLNPSAPPGEPQPFVREEHTSLPLENLPEQVFVPQPQIPPTSTPTPFVTSTPRATATPTLSPTPSQPTLPEFGPCVLATFEPTVINIRSGPGTDFDVVATMDMDSVVSVIGRNDDSSWYQIERGWVAGFVTRRGGDCSSIPITYRPATPTPIPPTDSPARIAGDNEVRGAVVSWNDNLIGFSGAISYPQGDRQDTITYRWADVPNSPPSDAQFRYTIRCSGDTPAEILFDDGSTRLCDETGYNFSQYFYDDVPTAGSITIRLTGGDDYYVEWNVQFSFYRGQSR